MRRVGHTRPPEQETLTSVCGPANVPKTQPGRADELVWVFQKQRLECCVDYIGLMYMSVRLLVEAFFYFQYVRVFQYTSPDTLSSEQR